MNNRAWFPTGINGTSVLASTDDCPMLFEANRARHKLYTGMVNLDDDKLHEAAFWIERAAAQLNQLIDDAQSA